MLLFWWWRIAAHVWLLRELEQKLSKKLTICELYTPCLHPFVAVCCIILCLSFINATLQYYQRWNGNWYRILVTYILSNPSNIRMTWFKIMVVSVSIIISVLAGGILYIIYSFDELAILLVSMYQNVTGRWVHISIKIAQWFTSDWFLLAHFSSQNPLQYIVLYFHIVTFEEILSLLIYKEVKIITIRLSLWNIHSMYSREALQIYQSMSNNATVSFQVTIV